MAGNPTMNDALVIVFVAAGVAVLWLPLCLLLLRMVGMLGRVSGANFRANDRAETRFASFAEKMVEKVISRNPDQLVTTHAIERNNGETRESNMEKTAIVNDNVPDRQIEQPASEGEFGEEAGTPAAPEHAAHQ